MEHRETERYEKAAADERDMQIKSDTLWYTLMPVMQFLMCFGEFIILFYVGNGILDGDMTLGEMSKYSMYASMIYGPLRILSNMPRQIINFITSTAKIFEIIDEEEEVADLENAAKPIIKGDVDINNVSFGYESGDEGLSHVDIHIKSGEFIGLVGKSGVGKSTLMTRLFPHLDLETGEISEKIARGKHTTRRVELYPIDGMENAYIADTPGFSMLDFARFNFFTKEDLPLTMREFAPHLGSCRFTKCSHTKEQGCAILDAVKRGEISKSRHESYVMLYDILKNKHKWDK